MDVGDLIAEANVDIQVKDGEILKVTWPCRISALVPTEAIVGSLNVDISRAACEPAHELTKEGMQKIKKNQDVPFVVEDLTDCVGCRGLIAKRQRDEISAGKTDKSGDSEKTAKSSCDVELLKRARHLLK